MWKPTERIKHHPNPGRRQTPASPHHILELGRPRPNAAQAGGGTNGTDPPLTPALSVRRTGARREEEDQGCLHQQGHHPSHHLQEEGAP